MSGWLKSAHDLKQKADLHLSAVQVLNDSLPGTAEQDCAQQDAKNALQPGLYEVQSTGVRVEDGKVHIDLDYTTAKPVPPR
jgi:hypothetical protein